MFMSAFHQLQYFSHVMYVVCNLQKLTSSPQFEAMNMCREKKKKYSDGPSQS